MHILNLNHPDCDGYRASGKTFRRMMESFQQSSAGNHVHYVVNDEKMRRWVFSRMMDIVKVYFGENVQYNGHRWEHFRFDFPSGGFIQIVTESEWNRRPVPSDVNDKYTTIEMWDCHQ